MKIYNWQKIGKKMCTFCGLNNAYSWIQGNWSKALDESYYQMQGGILRQKGKPYSWLLIL